MTFLISSMLVELSKAVGLSNTVFGLSGHVWVGGLEQWVKPACGYLGGLGCIGGWNDDPQAVLIHGSADKQAPDLTSTNQPKAHS